jgi:ubiquinone/menaquinone biosynthesis C-methylase UbiE
LKEIRRHLHSGISSDDFLDAESIIQQIGLKQGQTVLDLGCGEGHFSLAAAPAVGDEGHVVAVDAHEPSVNILRRIIAQENIGNILAFTADATKHLPIENNAIDVCLMVNVLHGFVLNEELQNVIREVVRVMKRHGTLIIVDFKKIETPAGPRVSQRLSPAEVEELLAHYGYLAETLDDIGPYSYLIRFAKR